MDLKLKGKIALITGSTAGIGAAIASSLFTEGAEVIVNGRTRDRVEEAVKRIKVMEPSRAAQVRGVVADLTTSNGLATLKESVTSVDILVNNLGVFESKAFSNVVEDDWTRMFETNVLGGAQLSQYFVKGMLERNWGRIIFIASEAGVNIPADMIPYGVSKAAQMALARGLAETTAGTAVTVNSILPGPTYSEGIATFLAELPLDQGQDRASLEQDFLVKLRPTSLIKRFATAQEVASLVTYIASPLSSATNGAALRVEGGLLRHAF